MAGGVSYRGTCPFCHTDHVELRAVRAWINKDREPRGLFECGFCGEGVIRHYAPGSGRNITDLMQFSGNIDQFGITLHDQWPAGRSTDAPADCPANVANFFKQAASSQNGGNFDAAGMMFRKSLEAATKAIDPNAKAKNLAGRIQALVASHILTPALGDWANEVRLGGNDAAHEEEPFTKEEAESLYHFTENFLNYAFTMPAAVSRRTSPTQG